MLTHPQIWAAIDRLAQQHGISVSALAKRAGLDATTFNRSKRLGPEGHPRWPSTESIAKILAATQTDIDAFFRLIDQESKSSLPLIPFRTLAATPEAVFDAAMQPDGAGWEHISSPHGTSGTFAIGVTDSSGAPRYKVGDTLIASAAVELRGGDAAVLINRDGSASLACIAQVTSEALHITALDGTIIPPVKRASLIAAARILWASQ